MTDIDRFDHQLAIVDSGQRAGVLLDACRSASVDEARALLAHWFNICDALAPWRDGLLEQFQRCGYVTDTDASLDLPVTVYRAAWADDDPRLGLSWTTEMDDAQRFARILTGPRAWFLGIRRDDVDPVIWTATCHAAYGYIVGRNENEVIPAELTDITVASVLVTVPKAEVAS